MGELNFKVNLTSPFSILTKGHLCSVSTRGFPERFSSIQNLTIVWKSSEIRNLQKSIWKVLFANKPRIWSNQGENLTNDCNLFFISMPLRRNMGSARLQEELTEVICDRFNISHLEIGLSGRHEAVALSWSEREISQERGVLWVERIPSAFTSFWVQKGFSFGYLSHLI